MTAKKWLALVSAVVVGVLVAAGVVWGVNAVSKAAAEARAPMERCEADIAERAERVGISPTEFCEKIRGDQPGWFDETYGN